MARDPGGSRLSFKIKDSGQRAEFDSGMVRDVEDDKTDYTLVLDGPMFERWAVHMTKGAKKYAARNWMKARGMAEYTRFKRSALRHFLQWFWGHTDEDHAAATIFNINGAEYVKEQMDASPVLIAPPGALVAGAWDCGNRYAHNPHNHPTEDRRCPGRAFDRT